tara:strand:- start:3149 stop:3427 length:279 start_codon:yes stop_codon:yes gene_type:complete
MSKTKRVIASKKSVHVNIEKETHADMRSILFKKDLTMQDFFSACATALASEENYFMNFLNEIKRDKENKTVEKISSTEADKIYDLLENESPF